jgi:arylsulfatase A-like enzyme
VITSRWDGPPVDIATAGRMHAQYRQVLACMDRSLGSLLDAVQGDASTIVVVVGDHGEQFGEHNLGGHGNSVYRQNVHVPLVLRIPGRASRVVTDHVTITDLYSTIVRATNDRDGRVALPLLEPWMRRPVLSDHDFEPGGDLQPEKGFGLVHGDYHFLRWIKTGREELYNIREDPEETRPLPLEDHREVVEPMRYEIMKAWRNKRGSSEFKALGYLR